MNSAPIPPTIKGWCPSALRPMETGDGLLVRLRLKGGELTAQTCEAIGSLAQTYGNGLIDLTQRGNLQLRGLQFETLSDLTAAMRDLGLLDTETANGFVSQVIGPPLAGIDRSALCDGKALVRDLETKLAAATDLQSLPDKFCFLVDDGGRFGLDATAADIRLMSTGDKIIIALGTAAGFEAVAALDPSEAVDAAISLARAFLKLSKNTSARRMYQLVELLGTAEIARAAGISTDASLAALPKRSTHTENVIGEQDGFVGIAFPFGQIDAGQMRVLAAIAPQGLRVTPWRAILAPDAKREALQLLKTAGFIVSPDDPRLAIVACSGQPACRSAQIDARRAAEQLAPLTSRMRRDGIAIHVSGCGKGCAHAAAAPITIVGRESAYDLILNGCAGGEAALRGLDLTQVCAAIDESCAGKAWQ